MLVDEEQNNINGILLAIDIIEDDTRLLKKLLLNRNDSRLLVETKRKITDNAKAVKKLRRKLK